MPIYVNDTGRLMASATVTPTAMGPAATLTMMERAFAVKSVDTMMVLKGALMVTPRPM